MISAGNLAIVVGDGEGGVTAVSPYGSLWKIRLQDASKQMYKVFVDTTPKSSLKS